MSVTKIQKRNGEIVDFDSGKIKSAIFAAAKSVGGKDEMVAQKLTKAVMDIVNETHAASIPSVEDIQDIVEKVLIEEGHARTAKAFILYRKKHEEIREVRNLFMDAEQMVEEYVNLEDWRVNENANMGFSLQGLNNHIVESITTKYWLHKIYRKELRDTHIRGDLHIHDLGLLAPYCCGWDLESFLRYGFKGAKGKIESKPPKHFESALGQLVNLLYTLQGESAGAQAVSSIDTYLAPFIYYDELDYNQVKKAIQRFVFNLNVPTRVGFQTPFTNITLDIAPHQLLKNQAVIIGGKSMDKTYKEFQKEMDMFNKAFCEVMMEGDGAGRAFSFPIPTVNITNDFPWDTEVVNHVMEMTRKFGTPYFANFMNSDLSLEDIRSMCPLASDTKVLVKSKQNGVRVSTIIDIVNNINMKGTEYEVWTPEGWKAARPIKVPMTDVYQITLSNGATVKMGGNHLQPIMNGEVFSARDLKEGMWLPFNKNPFGTELGDEDLGFVIGAYLGDGSSNEKAVIYSLDSDAKDNGTEMRLRDFWSKRLGFHVVVTLSDANVRFVRVNGNPMDIISRYVKGKDALTKALTRHTFNSSIEFKKGLIEGLRSTDGSRSRKRLYTSSEGLREDLASIFASMGQKYTINYIDEREGRLGTNPNYRIDYPERTNYGEYFKEDEDFHFFKITKIEPISLQGESLYCFEVDTKDHLFMLANGLITHNCRLRLDNRELRKRGGGLFGANPLTGSINVVTLNMARIGYVSKTVEEFKRRVRGLMEIAKEICENKRHVLEQYMDAGLYPYSRHYLQGVKDATDEYFKNHFSTIGLNGMNEACVNLLGVDITTEEGNEFAVEIMEFMNRVIQIFQEETGSLWNLEASPAEGASYRFARLDKKMYPNIFTQGKDEPYYTNSTQLPVGYTRDIFEALEKQEKLQSLYTGGTVLHGFIGEEIESIETCKMLIKRVFENSSLPYLTITPTFSICAEHGYIAGEHFNCPHCGREAEVWTRVVGFHRPVQSWNRGKQEEFKDREEFSCEESLKLNEDNIIEYQEEKIS
ncbi:ribonucleoside triphosphate reductase [Anaerosolibacter sp.]|uniref:ribonucleoside triphosphate reductase n=1 Tax=Anaerosolibacter sp. TaxID=1872527 RepID=UPI0039EF5CEB